MAIHSKTILAVNPGTRYLGLAVFQGNHLLDWRVRVLRGQWSKVKLEKAISILDAAIERYRPEHLAVKKLNLVRSSAALDILVERIAELCRRNRITIHKYSINALEEFFCQEKMNKASLAEAVAADYPALYPELNIEKARKNAYHMRMFEAVALGALCASKFDNH